MIRTCFTCARISSAAKRFLATAAAPKRSSTLAKDQQSIHPKTILANHCAKLNWRPPEFEYTNTGPPHQPKFSARIKVFTGGSNDCMVFSSSAHSRKALAMFEASLSACEELKKRGLLIAELPFGAAVKPEAPETGSTVTSKQTKTSKSVSKKEKSVESALVDEMPALIERHPHLNRLKQHPKSVLQMFSSVIKDSNKDYREPKAHFHMLSDQTWACRLSATWPVAVEFHARAASKAKAEHIAYLKLLQHLRVGGLFDENWQPKCRSRKELKEYESTRRTKVYLSQIPDELWSELDQMKTEAKEFEMELASLQRQSGNADAVPTIGAIEEDLEAEMEPEVGDGTPDSTTVIAQPENEKPVIMDIITNKALEPLGEQRFMERCHDLFTRYQRGKKRAEQKQDANLSMALPIAEKRKQIIELLSTNRAVIIAGGTGCGKTTQVPQFVFDDFVQRMVGADCNILITQPRRISAVSVAQRVASERFERIGDTVGYHVRLGMRSPVGHGSMLFATPAMILRKLWDNPNFEGISHVIIDEVHERDLWTDFLLIILKRALKANDKLKVILMSASMDSNKLSEYFGSCPVITVEGRNYEVQEHFLDDGSAVEQFGSDPPVTDHKAVVDVLSFVHQNREDGAILCFLPSWTDITKVRQMFRERHENLTNYSIYACHSRLPLAEQEKIFETPPTGLRKIVLATNIAETSITINDIRYVVNSGTRKNSASDKNLRSIRQEWASQSSQIQRKGRAGRVSHGECFHLFPKSTFDQMRPYDLPSMVKEPLENVVLFCKLCCPKEDPKILLEEALDKPPIAQINAAIRLLTSMNLLDEERNLTTSGAHVARLGCHPMLGLAMVYGSIYRCLEPIVTLTSILQTDGLVQTMTEAEEDTKPGNTEFEVKERFVGNAASDHLAQVNLFAAYQKAVADGQTQEFIVEYSLRNTSLGQSEALRRLFAWELSEVKLCDNVEQCLDASSQVNKNSGNTDLVKAVLAAGLHEQVIWLSKGVVNRGRILENKQTLMDEHGHVYMTPSSSLFRSRALAELDQPNQLFCYVNKVLVGSATKISRVDGLSALNPIMTLLFGGREPSHFEDGVVYLVGYRYQLCTNEEDATRLMETRQLIRQLVDWTLQLKSMKDRTESSSAIAKLDSLIDRVTAFALELTAKASIDKEKSQKEADKAFRR